MTSPEDPHLDVGAYVLHALPPAERAAFENHLAGCADCRAEVAAYQEITARLAEAEATTVPPHLRARTLDIISRTTQDRPRHRPASHRSLRLALAASMATAALLGGVAAWQYSHADDARTQAAQAHTASRAFTDVVTAPDATLHTEKLTGGGRASVVVSRAESRTVFAADGLPALSEDKVYELWYAAEAGDLRPAGLLPGTARQTSRALQGPLAGAVAVGITIEPAGGSRQPTTDPLAIIPITT
ncbi:anti-sigma factor [Streptomyces phaeoluteigriseus]|uniref:Regulator of SigK n=1 Tax=Streptomyces phaeoluteigriseus TaxID=114686 RepID=A0ABY4ZB54_9ACTN|nr:anti-sigma factor [Streptomyces phaeoluteigriseus]USQ85920.1 anti-sigma factor [Streptomyces phaeoluteigriseus]